jgi:hypothetical protein
LHLEDKLDFFPNASTFPFVLDPCNEVFIFITFHVAPLVFDPGFHFNLDTTVFICSSFIQVYVPS